MQEPTPHCLTILTAPPPRWSRRVIHRRPSLTSTLLMLQRDTTAASWSSLPPMVSASHSMQQVQLA